jgi:uncharacterized membrane protein HdeD (DUF308 family)
VRELGVTRVSSKAYNILAAVLCTVAAILTTAAIFVTSPTDARTLGIWAGIAAIVGGAAWIVAAVKG